MHLRRTFLSFYLKHGRQNALSSILLITFDATNSFTFSGSPDGITTLFYNNMDCNSTQGSVQVFSPGSYFREIIVTFLNLLLFL